MSTTLGDAAVIGSGPNGLAAGILLAQAGKQVHIYEAQPTVGGGMRTAELTEPGFRHDICSAVHPLTVASPFFRTLPLERYGLNWIHSPAVLAHPLDDGSAALLERDVTATANGLGVDGPAYQRLIGPIAAGWHRLAPLLLGPLLPSPAMLPAIIPLTQFGLPALTPATWLATRVFKTAKARALFAGAAAHAILPLHDSATSSFGLILLATGHAVGWPFPRGGAQQIAEALTTHFHSLGGQTITGCEITRIADLPDHRVTLAAVTPRQLVAMAGERLSVPYRAALQRYRYGPGAFKIDYALDGPVPWRASACARAATVHLGGTLEEIAVSEAAVWRGEHSEYPYVIVAQHSLFDASRAPSGKHTLWAYCHVPHGSTVDMTAQIEQQIERFAPGFRNRIRARHTMTTTAMEAYNPNYIGGDINGGAQYLTQLIGRPVLRFNPYQTSDPNLFICSSATPPGGGVHGMSGYHAARSALRRLAVKK